MKKTDMKKINIDQLEQVTGGASAEVIYIDFSRPTQKVPLPPRPITSVPIDHRTEGFRPEINYNGYHKPQQVYGEGYQMPPQPYGQGYQVPPQPYGYNAGYTIPT